MKINRNNYEEYFILYLDNELNAADRKMVESFAALHPDLKDELDTLAQFKLTPDTTIVFDTKEELLKSTDSLPDELQNTLLNYIDGELTTTEKWHLESTIQNNPVAKAELELLQKTKLEPEEIVYADKASLYRREKTYVIGMKWWRIAAAAVLLIGLGITTLILINNNNQDPGGEIVNKSTEKNQPAQPGINVKEQPVNDQLARVEEETLPQKEEKTPAIASENKTQPARSNNHNVYQQPVTREKTNDVIAHNDKPSNNLPEATNNPFVVKNNNPEVAANNHKPSTTTNEPLTNSTVTTQTPQPYIMQTSYSEDDAVDQPDSKKNKLRGFFRKVARTFEKRTNIETTSDDNKLLVAGLSINLK